MYCFYFASCHAADGCFLFDGAEGQKQRITLARALIRRAPLLILDEGTSALDKKTAYEIENYLLKNKDITLLTITHNPNDDLMMLYDEIYYMKDGNLEKQSKTIYTG